jgi:aryl-alcohol dehydrogenase-like predicted oxidoreductase
MVPIPGTNSIAHLEENVAAASIRLTDEEVDELTAIGGNGGVRGRIRRKLGRG